MRAFDVAGRDKEAGRPEDAGRSEFNFDEAHDHERRLQVIGLAAGSVVVAFFVIVILYSQGYMFRENTLQGMCNNPVVTGSEGSPLEGGELLAVVIAIRHGDRTPWASEMLDNPTQISCELEGELVDPSKVSEYKRISVVRPAKGSPTEASTKKQDKLHRSLLPDKDEATGHCLQGELTPLGIRQMFSLGEQLRSSYNSLLQDMEEQLRMQSSYYSSSPVVALSTDYQRTIGSAAAFLAAFLPTTEFNAPIDIIVETDRDETIWRQYRRCPKMTEGLRKQMVHVRGNFKNDAKALQKAAVNDWDELDDITDFADVMWVHYCHGIPLRVSMKIANKISNEANNEFCWLLAGEQGGRESNALGWYPILNDVVMSQLRKASKREENYKTVTLLSLHAHYMVGMMTTLGIFRTPEECEFPAFSSRLAFELWKKGDELFVRIYYNGKLMSGFHGDKDNSGLAKFDDLDEGLQSILQGKTWEQACEEPFDKNEVPIDV